MNSIVVRASLYVNLVQSFTVMIALLFGGSTSPAWFVALCTAWWAVCVAGVCAYINTNDQP